LPRRRALPGRLQRPGRRSTGARQPPGRRRRSGPGPSARSTPAGFARARPAVQRERLQRAERPMALSRALRVSLVASGLFAALPVAAEEPGPEQRTILDRRHTVAEAEAGIIALPSAPISAANRGGSTPIGSVGNGDATIELGV